MVDLLDRGVWCIRPDCRRLRDRRACRKRSGSAARGRIGYKPSTPRLVGSAGSRYACNGRNSQGRNRSGRLILVRELLALRLFRKNDKDSFRSAAMKCSYCGLISPPCAQSCDCGWNLGTQSLGEQCFRVEALGKKHARDILSALVATAWNAILAAVVVASLPPDWLTEKNRASEKACPSKRLMINPNKPTDQYIEPDERTVRRVSGSVAMADATCTIPE